MSHSSQTYSRILREAGYRVTEQREVILDAVCLGGGHSTLKEIFVRAQHTIPSLDVSSVYRALKLFSELGLVLVGVNSSGEDVYEIPQTNPHHHLICRDCGEEHEIDHNLVEAFYTELHRRYGFTTTSDHIVLFGRCGGCSTG